jgi:hypothetical protein
MFAEIMYFLNLAGNSGQPSGISGQLSAKIRGRGWNCYRGRLFVAFLPIAMAIAMPIPIAIPIIFS